MSFNDWFSSSSSFSQPLSIQSNVHDTKQQQDYRHHHHHHYHYYYLPMATTLTYPFYPQAHQEKPALSNPFAFVPSMPLIDHQLPFQHKEHIQRNSTLKLRRSVALFLHLIGLSKFVALRLIDSLVDSLDNSPIAEFLQHDEHFRHADKVNPSPSVLHRDWTDWSFFATQYLLAMVLIYFWRAKLREHHYSRDSFYLAL